MGIGARLPQNLKIDGVNLIPYLIGKTKKAPHEVLFWRMGDDYAVRRGYWKLVKTGPSIELFNLNADIAESHDLSAEHPDVVKSLTDAYNLWNTQMSEPLWVPSR
ncbi:MAG TPA: hypothetical protein HPP87_11550 [Planctomycetes bacterium]|nr:hypothetical protein [Planctomycetota bacterium]HIJ71978.1 hypothetical protein [Planctomycetota bacterium]